MGCEFEYSGVRKVLLNLMPSTGQCMSWHRAVYVDLEQQNPHVNSLHRLPSLLSGTMFAPNYVAGRTCTRIKFVLKAILFHIKLNSVALVHCMFFVVNFSVRDAGIIQQISLFLLMRTSLSYKKTHA